VDEAVGLGDELAADEPAVPDYNAGQELELILA
jgi:hypothetical protein